MAEGGSVRGSGQTRKRRHLRHGSIDPIANSGTNARKSTGKLPRKKRENGTANRHEFHELTRIQVFAAPLSDIGHQPMIVVRLPRVERRAKQVPSGTTENSPAIHRWANRKQTQPSPVGAKEMVCTETCILSSLRDSFWSTNCHPAMNRWAIIFRPAGLGDGNAFVHSLFLRPRIGRSSRIELPFSGSYQRVQSSFASSFLISCFINFEILYLAK